MIHTGNSKRSEHSPLLPKDVSAHVPRFRSRRAGNRGERPSCGRWEAGIVLLRSCILSNDAPTVRPLASSIAFAPIRLGSQRDVAVRLDGDENDCCFSTWHSDLVLGTQLLFMSMPKRETRGRQGYRCFQVLSQASNFLKAAQYECVPMLFDEEAS